MRIKSLVALVFSLASAVSAIALPSTVRSAIPTPDAFTYNNRTFFLHGEPYQIRAGQMEPQRIHPAYWHDRLFKAKAMGLNTMFAYVFWDLLEPERGTFDFTGRNNIASYSRKAQSLGLNVVLRAGSYACAERDWGGFPAWLLDVSDMEVRTNNHEFLAATNSYLSRLADEVRDLQVTHGGPILMAQVENEYGSYGSNHAYMAALRDIFQAHFDVPLFTDDGGGKSYLDGGQVHGVLAETDGDPKTGFEARDKYVTDPTSLGPQIDAEYYTTWLDLWASNYSHQTTDGHPIAKKAVYDDIDWILSNNNSFSLYMFHGGTNFGFENGALWSDAGYLEPVTSSYDYGAPLDESGRTTEMYDGLREVILKYVPESEKIPEVSGNQSLMDLSDLKLDPVASLFDPSILQSPTRSKHPVNMEALGQQFGYTLYEHEATAEIGGPIQPGDYPRTRVIVFVNDRRMGVSDSVYTDWTKVNVSLKKGDKLRLLVENSGRVDYGKTIPHQKRGIVGDVKVGGKTIEGWNMYPLPMDDMSSLGSSHHKTTSPSSTSPPILYKTAFKSPPGARCGVSNPNHDTFLSIPRGNKGQVWINGFNLGRYWIVGPQQSLYLPAPLLRDSGEDNELVVLELEPQSGVEMVARGLSKRVWTNHPDPDKPKRSH